MTVPASCACEADDAFECVRRRYPMTFDEDEDQAAASEAGRTTPCECACHDMDDESEEFDLGGEGGA